jgi:hypothetical protein
MFFMNSLDASRNHWNRNPCGLNYGRTRQELRDYRYKVYAPWLTESPFEGHVREYTAAELVWMLNTSGFDVLETSFFNYSMYGVKHPYLMNALSLVPMILNPAQRELIFMIARKT